MISRSTSTSGRRRSSSARSPSGSDVIYQMAPRTFDLLLLAASVFAADSLISRGGSDPLGPRSGLGAGSPVRRAGQRSRLLELGPRRARRVAHAFSRATASSSTSSTASASPRGGRGLGIGHGVEADQVVLLSGGPRLADRSDRRPDRLDRQGPAGHPLLGPQDHGASRSSSRGRLRAAVPEEDHLGARQGPPDRHQGPRDHPALAILPLRRARLCGRVARRRSRGSASTRTASSA